MEGFDLAGWILSAGGTVGILTPLVLALTRGSEKFGLSGKAQLAFAGVVGLLLGGFAQIALNGLPASVLDYFLLVLFAVMMAGVPVGTYEAIKSAATPKES